MWESTLLLLPPPTCIARTIAILLHVYCARYDDPPTPPLYAIHYTILVMTISCKGQSVRHRLGACDGCMHGWHSCLVWFLEQAAPLLGDPKALEFAGRVIARTQVTFVSQVNEAVCAMCAVRVCVCVHVYVCVCVMSWFWAMGWSICIRIPRTKSTAHNRPFLCGSV